MTFEEKLTVVWICALIAALAVLSCREHRRCTCEKRGTMLKPKWRKYGPKDRQ